MRTPRAFADAVLETVTKALTEGTMATLEAELDTLVTEQTTALVPITKVDKDNRLVYGWALVNKTDNGSGLELVIDRQGDIVEDDTLLATAHGYIADQRDAKVVHKGQVVGQVVESLVLTEDIQKALGINLGQTGWFIGMRIDDDATLAEVDAGNLPMFSVGGTGNRIPVAE